MFVDQIIQAYKAIYNIFRSGIFHKTYSIFKSKFYEFHNMEIGPFYGKDTIMAGYFMVMHRDLRMKKYFLPQLHHQNLVLWLSIINFLKSYHISLIINHGRDVIFYSKVIFLVLGIFVCQTAIRQ